MPRTAKPKTTIEKRIYHVEFDLEVTVTTDPDTKLQPVEAMVQWHIAPERLVRFMRNATFMASAGYTIQVRARKPTYTARIRRTFKKKVPYVVTVEEDEE